MRRGRNVGVLSVGFRESAVDGIESVRREARQVYHRAARRENIGEEGMVKIKQSVTVSLCHRGKLDTLAATAAPAAAAAASRTSARQLLERGKRKRWPSPSDELHLCPVECSRQIDLSSVKERALLFPLSLSA